VVIICCAITNNFALDLQHETVTLKV
jgi:hypothetical protein